MKLHLPVSILGACLLAASTALYAQAPKGERRHEQRFDCSKAKDPKLCEERLAKMKSAHDKARQACESKKGSEHRDCMQAQMCAQAKDPANCNAQAKERQARREKIREACKDKRGDDRKACVREHMKEGRK